MKEKQIFIRTLNRAMNYLMEKTEKTCIQECFSREAEVTGKRLSVEFHRDKLGN